MYSTRYSCPILMKLEFFSTDCRKILKYQISYKSSSGSLVVPCGRPAGHDEADGRFSQFLRTRIKREADIVCGTVTNLELSLRSVFVGILL
jgi:hypothetical protein